MFNLKNKNKINQEIREKNTFNIKLDLSAKKELEPELIDEDINKSTKDTLIELHNLYKTFGKGKKKTLAVDDLSFNIYKDQNMAILGANGAGKTTTIEMIAGISKPDKGSIIYKFPYIDSFHEGIGIQFQDSSYPVGLYVKDVIMFMINVYNVDLNEAEIKSMVDAFGLAKFYNRPARSLSGGQQQRLNILLALMHKPKVVFLDELSTGLDINIRQQIITFVKEYCSKFFITIILISHNMEEVEALCDRIIVLQKGKIKVDMYSKEIMKKYKSVEELAQKYI
ncbi:MAG: ABC transporter ATP-binding protein [Malacoplasma sp.]